jgi:hypothetical protein
MVGSLIKSNRETMLWPLMLDAIASYMALTTSILTSGMPVASGKACYAIAKIRYETNGT